MAEQTAVDPYLTALEESRQNEAQHPEQVNAQPAITMIGNTALKGNQKSR